MSTTDTEPSSGDFTFNIDGKQYDFLDLALGDIEELEDYADRPWPAIDYSRAGVLARVAWFFLRRDNANLTLEDVQKRPLSMMRTEPEERPTPPAKGKATA